MTPTSAIRRSTVCSAERGFTLLEMIVAIGIFAVVAAIAYGSLMRFLDTREWLAAKHAHLREVQLLFTLLERDVRYTVPRPVRDGFGDPEGALVMAPDNPPVTGEILRLTVAEPDPRTPGIQRLRRIAWRLEDGEVARVSWNVLDRDVDSAESRRTVARGVTALSARVLTWSDVEGLAEGAEWLDPDRLPDGVEFLLQTDSGRSYRRLLEVSNGG